jgi:hypothetical protein
MTSDERRVISDERRMTSDERRMTGDERWTRRYAHRARGDPPASIGSSRASPWRSSGISTVVT